MPKLLRQQPGSVGQYFPEHHQQGKAVEVWASKCAHCQHLTEAFDLGAKRAINVCRGCMRLICNRCADKGVCFTDEEQAEIEEKIIARTAKAHEIERWFNDR
jgi:hypothetical protein